MNISVRHQPLTGYLAGFLFWISFVMNVAHAETIEVTSAPFASMSPPNEFLFTRKMGAEIGVSRPLEFSFRDFWPPFWNGRGISSGDFDNDGDDDLVLASTDRGLHLFENLGDGVFEEIPFENMGTWVDFPGMLAGFVDMNNDGMLDIFISGYHAGMHVLWNDNGKFSFSDMSIINNKAGTVLAHAVSFGDVDHDSDLDLATGNWAAGWYRRFPGEESRNRVIFNDGGEITGENFVELEGFTGETLSIILSDIDSDGNLDIIEGNDFEIPDQIYYGDGNGEFERYLASVGTIVHTTTTTMSVKSTDLNGDLLPDLYFSQIAGRAEGLNDTIVFRPLDAYCDEIPDILEKAQCEINIETNIWYKSGGRRLDVSQAVNCAERGPQYEIECKSMMIKDVAIQKNDPEICKYIDESQIRVRLLCETHFRPQYQPTHDEFTQGVLQKPGTNVLLLLQDDGEYIDVAGNSDIEVGGWAWDTKTEDFDLNGTTDVYVTNGTWVTQNVSPSNMYFENDGNAMFENKTSDVGLDEYFILPAVTASDLDGDGDLDLIGQSVNGPVITMRNNSQNDNRFGFKFDDQIGNRFCIGCKLIVHQSNGQSQIREIQSGGGFLSYDSPKLYFGMPDGVTIESVEVSWSTGEVSKLDNEFIAGSMYLISRASDEE